MWANVARREAPRPAPRPCPSFEGASVAVIDANALISPAGLLGLRTKVDRVVTVAEVLAEVRDKRSRDFVKALPFEIETLEPTAEHMAAVSSFAHQTGDAGVLSTVDRKVIALARMLEVRQHGPGRVRPSPPAPQVRARAPRRDDLLPGWGATGGDWADMEALDEEELARAEAVLLRNAKSRVATGTADIVAGGQDRPDRPAAPGDAAPRPKTLTPGEELAADLSSKLAQARLAELVLARRQAEGLEVEVAPDGPRAATAEGRPAGPGPAAGRAARAEAAVRRPGVPLVAAPAARTPPPPGPTPAAEEAGSDVSDDGEWTTSRGSSKADRRHQRKQRQKEAAARADELRAQMEQRRVEARRARTAAADLPESRVGAEASAPAASLASAAPAPAEEASAAPAPAEEASAAPAPAEEASAAPAPAEEASAAPAPAEEEGSAGTPRGEEDDAGSEGGSEDDSEEGSEDLEDVVETDGGKGASQEGGADVETASSVLVLTGDFAMQNVILQMGLRLVAPDGHRVTRVARWALRCSACQALTRDAGRIFCPRCGNSALDRVRLQVGPDGAEVAGVRQQHNLRGTRFSLPKPRGGRRPDVITSEDMLLIRGSRIRRQAQRAEARTASAALDPNGDGIGFGLDEEAEAASKARNKHSYQATVVQALANRGGAALAAGWRKNPNERKHVATNRRRK